MNYPKKVVVGDITVRDGFQHEEIYIPVEAKLWVLEQLILAGFRHLEVTNLGNPSRMPQFKDADELMKMIRNSKKVSHLINQVSLTCVTINEKAVERAIISKEQGYGPDRILMLISLSESYQKRNTGMTIEEYWEMAERCIKKARDAGIKVNGTINTIWGCPIEGPTDMKKGIDFSKRWFDIGASDIEHADHDGSASPDRIYRYFSMLVDEFGDSSKHIVHLHSTRGWGLANILAALQAGMTNYESTLGGTGGQPANFVSGVPVSGTGEYYNVDPYVTGLICTEDLVVMLDEMGIETNLEIDKVLQIGKTVEKIIGRKLRSECIRTGRIPKSLTGR